MSKNGTDDTVDIHSRSCKNNSFFTLAKEERYVLVVGGAFVCLPVCLVVSNITQKVVDGF